MRHTKKAFSLDYSIEKDTDRLHAVEQILDELTATPSSADLELMASYILYGKDENGQNAVQRGETTDSNKRYGSWLRYDDKNLSLDAVLEDSTISETDLKPADTRQIYLKKKPTIKRPKYDKEGNMVDPGDSDVPGMTELWDTIDRLEHIVAVNDGKVPPDGDTQIFTNAYRYWQFKHALIDVKRHQYYLRDAYKPEIHFAAIHQPKTQTVNWDSDSFYWMTQEEWKRKVEQELKYAYSSRISKNLADYETRTLDDGTIQVKWVVQRQVFDWENPFHIRALMRFYSPIYAEMWDRVDSWGRTLIYDFDRYFDMGGFSPLREYVLLRFIDGANYLTIAAEVEEKFDVEYSANRIMDMINEEIPKGMATAAKKHRLMAEWDKNDFKTCFTCKKAFPRCNLFFTTNRGRRDGFASNCKDCERISRKRRGLQAKDYDRRSKDPTLPKVQTRETN